ncbi:hypothetical protein N7520_002323 [Penicillium odoratum]|uniref:uncharacterized protein n=1 Tax=Penicillium odoratum TaxID=1167516 RepID=UPI002548997B|nr:uncharacterized protein N7520_002323 [Penicillium odoratum]KAJ5771794.1 hypothetical protein N7520_002323 [Penicillium odoratum]
MSNLASHICVKRIEPPDQLWNALLSKAWVVIHLSRSEGYQEKLLGAVQKGKPVITTKELDPNSLFACSFMNIYGINKGDAIDLAEHLRDEFSTIGNTMNWLFLASAFSRGDSVKPNGESILKLAKKAAQDRGLQVETELFAEWKVLDEDKVRY